MAATGTTVHVKTVGDAQGSRFEPANVTVHAGNAVEWANVSGGPHNVIACAARHLIHTDPACRPLRFMYPSLLPRGSTFPPTASYSLNGPVRARAIAAAARARLGPLCANWPPEQFSALISDVVRFRERWDAWDA